MVNTDFGVVKFKMFCISLVKVLHCLIEGLALPWRKHFMAVFENFALQWQSWWRSLISMAKHSILKVSHVKVKVMPTYCHD